MQCICVSVNLLSVKIAFCNKYKRMDIPQYENVDEFEDELSEQKTLNKRHT